MLECTNGSIKPSAIVEEVNKKPNAITSTVVVTVGVDKDFTSLHEAIKSIEAHTFVGQGRVKLILDDGIHVLGGEGTFNEDSWSYYEFKFTNITIESASGNRTACTITLDAYNDGDMYPTIFTVYNSWIIFNDVTFNPGYNGYSHYFHVTIADCYTGSSFVIDNGFFVNFMNIAFWLNSSGRFNDSTFNSAGYAAIYNLGGKVDVDVCSFVSCTTALHCAGSSIINGTDMTFTNNTQNSNIPFNELQYDASFISDNTGPLSFKA